MSSTDRLEEETADLSTALPRISYFALLATSTCAALRKESMQSIRATGPHRKSGGAQWRDLRFSGSFLEMFSRQISTDLC